MHNLQLKAVIEGLLFVSGDEGMTVNEMVKVVEVDREIVIDLLDELTEDYEQESRGMTIMRSNDVYHLTTKREHSLYYKKLLETPRASRLSQSALETLAIIAYRQPITRIEIEDIRGVNSDYAIQILNARSLIEETGRKETIGRPILYGTTTSFLTYFGLSSIDDLPSLPKNIDKEEVKEEADLFLEQLSFKDNKAKN